MRVESVTLSYCRELSGIVEIIHHGAEDLFFYVNIDSWIK
jgi:hypothetical protein